MIKKISCIIIKLSKFNRTQTFYKFYHHISTFVWWLTYKGPYYQILVIEIQQLFEFQVKITEIGMFNDYYSFFAHHRSPVITELNIMWRRDRVIGWKYFYNFLRKTRIEFKKSSFSLFWHHVPYWLHIVWCISVSIVAIIKYILNKHKIHWRLRN